jgi:nitrite reductase/ring-hydroxylating ferredoxin subunit
MLASLRMRTMVVCTGAERNRQSRLFNRYSIDWSNALSEEFQAVAALSDVAEGKMNVCQFGGKEVVLCRTKDGVFALDNICTHALARMNEGRLRGQRLICPLHGASFDVRDGRVLGAPATQPLACYRVRVTGDTIEIAPPIPASG